MSEPIRELAERLYAAGDHHGRMGARLAIQAAIDFYAVYDSYSRTVENSLKVMKIFEAENPAPSEPKEKAAWEARARVAWETALGEWGPT